MLFAFNFKFVILENLSILDLLMSGVKGSMYDPGQSDQLVILLNKDMAFKTIVFIWQ